MNKLIKTIAVFAALAAPLVSYGAVQKGLKEVGIEGAFTYSDYNGGHSTDTYVAGTLGYFVTDAIEVIGGISLNYFDDEFGSGHSIMLGAGVDYHFNTQSNFVPYVGASIFWGEYDYGTTFDDFAGEVRGGIKQFLTDNVALKYQVFYRAYDKADSEDLGVGLGLSYFF